MPETTKLMLPFCKSYLRTVPDFEDDEDDEDDDEDDEDDEDCEDYEY